MDIDISLSGIQKDSSFLDKEILSETREESQTESYSAAQVLDKLERAWMDEKMCPELLEHHMEFVDVMLEQLKELEVMISQATSKADIRVAAHLEEFAQLIASDPIEQTKLTDDELTFVTGFWSNIKTHLDESAGKNMPENVRKINMDKMMIKPEYYKYVFIKVEKPITGVTVSEPGGIEDEVVDFDEDDQQLLPYKTIQNLLMNGSVHLI
ncbi:hypothetical protein EB796_001408 [Bugula neritina]|uniref:DNA replication complex GINS protein SLD5 n=1 Tax=Bugula neritina TaxID=10212 RepID=A0A7J7KQ25_BUGNE|nr:hypothetical protein EB796_001408 [Bugula neritina]